MNEVNDWNKWMKAMNPWMKPWMKLNEMKWNKTTWNEHEWNQWN